VAPLLEICKLGEKYNAMVFIDECHATGFFGSTGRGTEEFVQEATGQPIRVDIINSTLGKALGGASGGYTAGSKVLVDLLRQRGRPYLFSNSLPPPVVGCANKVFDLLLESSNLCQKVAQNTRQFRAGMTQAGFTILGENHPICPVFLGDASLASKFADKMLGKYSHPKPCSQSHLRFNSNSFPIDFISDEGIYVIGFSYPVVPKGKARIRVQISAAHEPAEIQQTIEAFVKVGKSLGVI